MLFSYFFYLNLKRKEKLQCLCFFFTCSWWTCNSAIATSGVTFLYNISSSFSTWRGRSNLKGEARLCSHFKQSKDSFVGFTHLICGKLILFSLCFCFHAVPAAPWMMTRVHGLRIQQNLCIRSVIRYKDSVWTAQNGLCVYLCSN